MTPEQKIWVMYSLSVL